LSEAELTQYKDKNHVDEILRQLELEREKNAKLSIQLQQQISRLSVLLLSVFFASVRNSPGNSIMALGIIALCTWAIATF